jgi:probable addiction module antidote protein
MKDRSHDEAMSELFATDPAFAANYLDDILQDGEPADLLVALRQMANAFGGVQKIAQQSKLNPTQLYRTLSNRGNPEVRSLAAVLRSMGLRLSVKELPRKRVKSAARSTIAIKSKR